MLKMSGMRDPADKTVVRLLSVVACLLSLIVIGLGVGGVIALREYTELKKALPQTQGADLAATLQEARAALNQLTDRQDALASALGKEAAVTKKKMAALQSQRRKFEEVRSGPIDKMAQAIRLCQLLADEALTMMDHTVRTQEALANNARPLKFQRQAREGTEPKRD
jgi:hypothetical protein